MFLGIFTLGAEKENEHMAVYLSWIGLRFGDLLFDFSWVAGEEGKEIISPGRI